MTTKKLNVTTARTSFIPALCFSCFLVLNPALSLAQTKQVQDRSAGSITELPLPKVADYWVTATRQAAGATIFDGYVPDENLRTELAARSNVDTQWMRLGSGAPDNYAEALDFGLAILDRLAEGRFALRENAITVNGVASSEDDFVAVTKAVAADMPSGFVLASFEVLAPAADTYEWRAQKSADGAVILSGMVPDPALEKILLASAGPTAKAQFRFASGQPDAFSSSARTGISLLKELEEGQVSFDGKAWVLSGTASSRADKAAIERDFERQQLAASGWSLAVAAPADTPLSEPTAVNPEYAFSATKAGDDSMIFSGQVPAEPALRFFAAISGGNIDAVSISGGAPADFVMQAEAGVRALMLLDEGSLTFAQGTWSLSGTARDAPSREAVLDALDASGRQKIWKTDIALIAVPDPMQQIAVEAPTPMNNEGLAACEAPLAEFSARNAILFRSGAAQITPDSAPALDELAADLGACPATAIHVEGHTDADGDEQLNLALSVARAEAVVNALIERGVAPERLYALGYGESNPIADNTTPEGKALNRRIVVKIASEL
ncbi:OmpA family protein [Devosia submarina]|uniref:OmpA family protein n=1 Tax=Devosia submarina TaxID=1173082 RepID=UPI000D3B550E|nr:OmpA family protein [Devosia submarina]